ncbi:MAG: carboxypeptidase-like regulatory domain-containing protein, partial [Flavisolibacter sp.]|nr:carboxypeptidase-like regulatory domain-containing protein [Flavisolibacter sp.]
MRSKKLVAILLMLCLAFEHDLYAKYNSPSETNQKVQTVTGTVTDSKTDAPLVGVSIQVKGTTQGTTTDANGRFNLDVPDKGAVLIVSYIGYAVQEINVTAQTTSLTIKLDQSIGSNLDEVVVVGYGTQRRGEVTSAVSSIKSDKFTKGFARDAAQLVQGKVAGLSVSTVSGSPTAGTQISLRGITTLNSSTAPLVLIDGIPGSLNTVAPEDIESVDVLKDGSAAAIYGTRGTNGVILITTVKRRGGNRPPTLSYSGYVSYQQIAKKMEFLTAEDYRRLISQNVKGFNQNLDPTKPGYTTVAGANDDWGASTDWFKEITQ